jgi:DNA-binding transcriptional LysR family regulator
VNLRALTAFCLTLRRGSLSAAARDMNLSQPAVSRLIAALEHEVGFALFHRDRRALRPTDEARRFYREAERILAGVEQLGSVARDIRRGDGQTLRVVALSRLATGLLPRAAAAFARAMPDVDLIVETHHRRDMERWLTGRQFDVGFGPLPIGEAALNVAPLGELRAVAAFAAPGPFPPGAEVGADVLAGYPLIALTPDTLLQAQTDAIFAAAGAVPREAMRTSSSQVACLLAAEGLGYCVTDPITARGLGGRVAVHPIRPAFLLTYGVLTPRDQAASPPARLFAREMELAIQALADHAPDASDPHAFALDA